METRLTSQFQAAVNTKKVPGIGAIVLDKNGGIVYKGTFGTTNINDPTAPVFTPKTPVMIWSCTKLVTATAALQLLEQGKLKLDDLVETYVPRIKQIQVLTGFDVGGEPVYKVPERKVTVLMLLTHTAGFSYDFFDEGALRWRVWSKRQPATYIATGEYADVETPLIFDPGETFNYGCSTDWLGFVIEAVSGMRLDEYINKHIMQPLGLTNTGAHLATGLRKLDMHVRHADGTLTADATLECAPTPEFYGGGHYLYSTLDEFSQFLLTILNYGEHPITNTRILKEHTVKEYLFSDQLSKVCPSTSNKLGLVHSFLPPVSNNGELLPGLSKSWSCGLLLNTEAALKGRSAGSGMWAGLGNQYYWLDPEGGKLGFVVTEILPFMDPPVLDLFDELERAVYGHDSAKKVGEVGGNYRLDSGVETGV